jgi:hypothetical protein
MRRGGDCTVCGELSSSGSPISALGPIWRFAPQKGPGLVTSVIAAAAGAAVVLFAWRLAK